MSKDRRRRSESSRDSINVTDKIQHGFSCEGPVNHYGSPITGREGTFRLPRRVVSFHGSSIFYLYFATLEGEWLEKNKSVFPNFPRRAYADRGRMDGDQVCVCVWFLVKFLWTTWRRLINFYHDSSLFFFNSECRDKCTQRRINERYLHVDNSLT